MAVSIDDLIGRVKTPVRSVTICLDADLQSEHDALSDRLELLRRENIAKMGDGVEAREIAEQIRAVEDRMREAEQVFKFKGISSFALNALYKRFPAPAGKNLLWDVETGAFALLAACAVEPAMTEDQAQRLADAISQGQLDKLVGAAWVATTGKDSVPFSVRASELTRASE